MCGVCFVVKEIELLAPPDSPAFTGADTYGPFTGQVMSAMKDACRKAFLTSSARLMEPMLLCSTQSTGTMLGNVYAVLNRRRARVLKEELQGRTSIFSVRAYLPAAESHYFQDDLRKKTSGAASAQLVFSHYEAMVQDPLDRKSLSLDELEEWGAEGHAAPNLARTYMHEVRTRKGLLVEKKVVEFAEKQRTLMRKK